MRGGLAEYVVVNIIIRETLGIATLAASWDTKSRIAGIICDDINNCKLQIV